MLDCDGCLLKQSIVHELQFLLLMLALHQFGNALHWRWLKMGARLLLLACLIIMLIDVAVLRMFLVRFNWHELLKFSGELDAAKAFVVQWLDGHFLQWLGIVVAILAFAGIGVCYVTSVRQTRTKAHALLACIVPFFTALFLQSFKEINFHTPYSVNSVAAFVRMQTRFVPYEIDPVPAGIPADHRVCTRAKGMQAPLILLVVESMSNFHSKALSGIHDWTPRFDNWLGQGLNVTGFYANGITTEDGLVALLTGQAPVPHPQVGTVFTQYASGSNTLPAHLRSRGYHTAFLTTGNLSFMDKGFWLKEIGFSEVEGHDHAFYSGMPRFHFDAASDEALYARAMQWIRLSKNRLPYFLTLETVSTHQPFKNPVTGENSLEAVVRYADLALGDFLSALTAEGYFDYGYVLITGDHRTMVPLSQAEKLKYGDQAFSRVPMLVLGPGLDGQKTRGNFSQTDVAPTIDYLTGLEQVCHSKGQGVFWPGAEREPDCFLSRRAFDQDLLIVQCADQTFQVKLEGHKTRYLSQPAGPSHWIEQVHRFRTGRGWGN